MGLELDEVDSILVHAVEMGATMEMPVAETFWGEQYDIIRDPFGHHWFLSTRREQLAPDEVTGRVPEGPPEHGWTAKPAQPSRPAVAPQREPEEPFRFCFAWRG